MTERYRLSFDVDKALARRQFSGPSLFVCGRQDDCVGFADRWALAQTYPRATLAVADTAGHNLQLEQPALFEALVRDWPDRVERYPQGTAGSCAP